MLTVRLSKAYLGLLLIVVNFFGLRLLFFAICLAFSKLKKDPSSPTASKHLNISKTVLQKNSIASVKQVLNGRVEIKGTQLLKNQDTGLSADLKKINETKGLGMSQKSAINQPEKEQA